MPRRKPYSGDPTPPGWGADFPLDPALLSPDYGRDETLLDLPPGLVAQIHEQMRMREVQPQQQRTGYGMRQARNPVSNPTGEPGTPDRMADDPEVLRQLLQQNLERRREAQRAGDTEAAIKIMEESEQLHNRLMAIEDPVRRGIKSDPPPPPQPPPPPEDMQSTTAAPDLAVEGERTGLDPNDPRVKRAEQRDVSRQLGQGDAEQIMRDSEAARQQQLRSPTAVHGGSANMNARFGPGSPLGATPDHLPWDRPHQTDPKADPVGIVPGDRPIRFQRIGKKGEIETDPTRFERRDRGQGIWTGHISRPDMDRRVREAMEGRGYYADKIKPGMSPQQVRAVIERGDTAQQGRSRGSRARLKEKHALDARAASQGLGLDPPQLHQRTSGGRPVDPGSTAHLRQAREQESQQRVFLRHAKRRGRDSGGNMPGFDHQLYNQLKRTDPPAAANMLNNYRRNQLEAMNQAGNMADRRRTRQTADRQATAAERRVDLLEKQDDREERLTDQVREEAAPAKQAAAFKVYQDTTPYPDPHQASADDEFFSPSAGVNTANPEHWARFVALRDADESTPTGKWDRAAYKTMKYIFDSGTFKGILGDNAESYADHIMDPDNRAKYGIPGWMTRSHIIMAYGHFGTDSDVFDRKKFERDWWEVPFKGSADNPEDWDFHTF